MAQFQLNSFFDAGTHGYHTATSWRVTKDSDGLDIIDESLEDKEHLLHWITPLPDGNGWYYADLDEIHLWVRVHILDTASEWVYGGYMNQNDQTFIITENDTIVETVNSLIAGIQ